MTTTIETKYGKAYVNSNGYYQIGSRKEGNKGKMLHRLVFEDFYNIKLDEEFPNGVHIHHVDGNQLNNEIWNLEPLSPQEHQNLHHVGLPMPEHVKQILRQSLIGREVSVETRKKLSEAWTGKNNPMYGKTPSIESRKKMSKKANSSGFYRVQLHKRKNPAHNPSWEYIYRENRKVKSLSSVDLTKLKQKVLDKGLEWLIIDLKKAENTAKEYGYNLEELL
jgi:hypothetical protein